MMSICDNITDDVAQRIASATHKLTRRLLAAGIDPELTLDGEEIAALRDLVASFPAPAMPEEGA